MSEKYMDNLRKEFERLHKIRVVDEQVKEYIELLLPVEKNVTLAQLRNIKKFRENMASRYFETQDLQNVVNNAYRFISAVSDFATHANPLRTIANYNENLFVRSVEGKYLIDRAYHMVCAA